MVERSCVALAERGVLEIAGADRSDFLQGLVSNDVSKVSTDRALYAALLTAQGKYLHDFFITEIGDAGVRTARQTGVARIVSIAGTAFVSVRTVVVRLIVGDHLDTVPLDADV